MATEVAPDTGASDPLRRTLDTLHLDPNAAADRPYLESMLRRLGYSEAEIQAYLGSGKIPAAPGSTVAPDEGAERQIEVEYTGPGLKDFKLVIGVDQSELPAIAAEEAGTEVFEAGPSMEEVDRLVAEGGFGDFDDWGDTTPKEDAVGELGETPPEGAEGEKAPDAGGGEAPPEGAPEIKVEKGSAAGTEIPLPEKVGDLGPDFQPGEPLVEFKPTAFNEPESVNIPDPKAEAEALKAEGWDVADTESGEFEIATWELEEPEAPTPAPETMPAEEATGPFQYKDWMLYSRDELRGDQPQRIYFFSKGAPDGSEPASLPGGYEVAENPDTGRPFLRRAAEGSGFSPSIDAAHPSAEPGAAPKKRVRILRVRAATREEAIKKLQSEGRNVIASMPIDIEKRFGE